MTSRERVKTAFDHKEADRVPLGEMHIMPHASSELLGREAITGEGKMYYQAAALLSQGRRDEFVERFVQDTLDVVEKAGQDFLMSELNPAKDASYEITELGPRGWTERDKDTGFWRKFVYEEENQITMEMDSSEKQGGDEAVLKHVEALERTGGRIDPTCFDATRELCRRSNKQHFCMAKIPNLIPSGRSWYTDFMTIAMTDPELTKRICDAYLKVGMEAARGYLDCGVDGVMIATDWAMNTGPLFPPPFIQDYLVPQVNAIAKFCHDNGLYVMKHTDGNINPIAELFFAMDIDVYQGIEPFAGMKIGDIKKKYGHKVALMGNVDCGRTLPFGTKEEIIEETKQCIRLAAHGGGFLLSSSNTISYPISASAFMTMVETAHKYGTYPISI